MYSIEKNLLEVVDPNGYGSGIQVVLWIDTYVLLVELKV
nr:MAG TPA: hypothetical protein [Caudoviricetes sp.]